jgi:ABC-type nitrate/sulfonate/bicarbonate transport system substrate-binding protein
VRIVKKALLALLLAVALVAPARADAEVEHVRVVLPDRDNLQYLAFWVAIGAGYFADESIALDIDAPASPPATFALVHERTADVFVLPPPVYLQLIAEKFPLLLVANLLQNDPIDVVVRKRVMEERKLSPTAPLAERLAGLRGLRVGVAPGPPPRLRALFAAVGLDADKEVRIVTIRGPDQNEAFAHDDVDALFCHTPYLETALVEQDAQLLVNQSAGEVPSLAARQIHALVVTQDLARARPALVFALARAVVRATRLVRTDARAAADAVMRALPQLDRKKVDTLVAIYQPAVPETPRVSVDGIDPALVLFPASRAAPDLRGIDLHEYVAPAFVERAIADASEAAKPWWKRRARWLAAAAIVIAVGLALTRLRRTRSPAREEARGRS